MRLSGAVGPRTSSRPLFKRYPALAKLPHVPIGRFPTPVLHAWELSPTLWVKRDDRSADPLGGNKIRSLEFQLANMPLGEKVVTVGPAGSTHALSLATYTKLLGGRAFIGRWRQEMNVAATIVDDAIPKEAEDAPTFRTPMQAYFYAWKHRMNGARWIPAGGTSPVGILGHVDAALELAEQLEAGELPLPRVVVVPLGSGGTAAGLTLGFAIAGVHTRVMGARVVPRVIGRTGRVLGLIERTAKFMEEVTGEKIPRPHHNAFEIAHESFGGAYGRETKAGMEATGQFRRSSGLTLDATYSAKACALALTLEGAPVLFWLTFDSRIVER